MADIQKKIFERVLIKASALVFLGLALLGMSISKAEAVWGLVGLFVLSKKLVWGYGVAAALLVLFGDKVVERISRFSYAKIKNPILICFPVGLVFAGLFCVMRAKNVVMGDGLLLIDMIHAGDFSISAGSLTMAIVFGVSKILQSIAESPVLLSFRVVAIWAGIIYAAGSYLLSRQLFEDKAGRILSVSSFWTLGIVQLFFGYVENYALPYALTPLFFYFAFKLIENKVSILAAFGVFIIMCGLHLTAVSLWPAVLYLVYVNSSKNPFYKARHLTAFLAVLGGAAAGYYYLSGLEGHVFVSVLESKQFPYVIFSKQYVADILNQVILCASFGLFLLLMSVLLRDRNAASDSRDSRVRNVAGLAALSAFLFSAVIDPKLGAFRDWDLKGFYAVPLMVAGLTFVRSNLRMSENRNTLAAVAVAFILFFNVPWIVFNYRPVGETLGIISSILEADVHHTPEYDEGMRMRSWAVLLTDPKIGGFVEAEEALEVYLAKFPGNTKAQHLLTYTSFMLKKYDKAYVMAEELLKKDDKSAKIILQTGHLAVLAGNYQEGLDYLGGLRGRDTLFPVVIGVKAQANYALGNVEIAEAQFRESYLQGNKDWYFLTSYSEFLDKAGMSAMAKEALEKADSLEYEEKKFK